MRWDARTLSRISPHDHDVCGRGAQELSTGARRALSNRPRAPQGGAVDAELLHAAVARLRAVISHQSAALFWGIELVTAPDVPDVTLGRNRSRAQHTCSRSWEDVVHSPDYVVASISRCMTELRAAA